MSHLRLIHSPRQGTLHLQAPRKTILERRIEIFRAELNAQLIDDDKELRQLRIQEAIERAEEEIPRHDTVQRSVRGALSGIEMIMDQLLCILENPEQDDGVETNLELADTILSRWDSTDRPQLMILGQAAADAWYHPLLCEPVNARIAALSATFDCFKVKVKKAKTKADLLDVSHGAMPGGAAQKNGSGAFQPSP